MDTRFLPAVTAVKAGYIHELKSLIEKDPSLAIDRSSCSHPTLLQCLALEAIEVPNQVDMAEVLIKAGSDIDEPLVAAASINNVPIVAKLLDAGAAIDGDGNWSPLEEALYWNQQETIQLLLERGARISNLRTAAGLGRTDLIESFFNIDGSLKPGAGKISWPFNDPKRKVFEDTRRGWKHDRQELINNAFIYACMNNRLEAAKLLLEKGAEINAIPPGFDFAGTGLHNAAVNGHRELAEFLINHGADPCIKDLKVYGTAADWAEHGGHIELKNYLELVECERERAT
jgi:ankyrin repeat protein